MKYKSAQLLFEGFFESVIRKVQTAQLLLERRLKSVII
jgi:hypothetical protein